MADVLLPIVPFTVPTTVTLVADVAPKSEAIMKQLQLITFLTWTCLRAKR